MTARENCTQIISGNLEKSLEISASYKTKYISKSFIKKLLRKERKLDPDISDWKKGLITEGLASSDSGKETLYRFFDWFNFLIGTGETCFWFPDQLMTAGSILKLILDDEKGEYRPLAVNAASSFKACLARSDDGTLLLPYRGKKLYLDQIGIMGAFCVRASRFFGTDRFAEILEQQILFTLKHQCAEDSSFPYHSYDLTSGERQGRNSWGRGLGWWLMGISAYLAGNCQSAEHRDEILQYSVRCIAELGRLQDDNGYLYEDVMSRQHIDTSATAMCGFAACEICNACRQELTAEEYEAMLQFAEKCAEAVSLSTDDDGRVTDCSGECKNYGDYSTEFGSYYAEGPALMLFHILEQVRQV